MTKKELEAENAGLRELLAAVRAYVELPHPADYDNRTYGYELERRADAIAVWANGDREDMAPDVYVLVIQDRAKHLREEAAMPVRYEVRAEPASPEAVAALADSIADGTPLLVTDDEDGPCMMVGCGHGLDDHSLDLERGDRLYCQRCECRRFLSAEAMRAAS